MYAVIETGGKQYKVAVGDKLRVEKLPADAGASVALGRVLMVADSGQISTGESAADTAVSATVIGHGRGDKIRVFKMKRRKDYRRTSGHRQAFTEIVITAIGGGAPVAAAADAPDAPDSRLRGNDCPGAATETTTETSTGEQQDGA